MVYRWLSTYPLNGIYQLALLLYLAGQKSRTPTYSYLYHSQAFGKRNQPLGRENMTTLFNYVHFASPKQNEAFDVITSFYQFPILPNVAPLKYVVHVLS